MSADGAERPSNVTDLRRYRLLADLERLIGEEDTYFMDAQPEGCMTQSQPHLRLVEPEPAYGWCAPCGSCHVAPFCAPAKDVDEMEDAA